MRKMLLLMTVAIVTASAGGCRLCDRVFRGSAVTSPAPVCCEPASACAPQCDPCGSGGAPAPVIVSPGPETYAPAPVR